MSKRYEGQGFIYWWDISPGRRADMDDTDTYEFVCKDTGASCAIPVSELLKRLTPDRQTTRGKGNWGVRVLVGHEDELAIEPATRDGQWEFIRVVWQSEDEPDEA